MIAAALASSTIKMRTKGFSFLIKNFFISWCVLLFGGPTKLSAVPVDSHTQHRLLIMRGQHGMFHIGDSAIC